MPQAQNWNKSQSLQSTLFFSSPPSPPLHAFLCPPLTDLILFTSPLLNDSHLPFCFSSVSHAYLHTSAFFFFFFSPHFGLLLFLVSCCFSLKCFAAEMRLLAIFTKKQSNLMPLEAIKEKTSLVPEIENSITVSHSAFQ